MTPMPDRRQQPRIPGMIVTRPATHRHTCEELGVCQNTGLCDQCSDGAGVPPQAGNVWFAEPEPPEPMNTFEKISATALIVLSAVTAVSLIGWLAGSALALYTGPM